MSNITEYPVFEADQVLKADHLNNMFNYLDEQNRLTRRYLTGIGIVCGLDSFYENNSVTITKGVGVTSLGYIIQFDGGTYTNARSYKLPDDVFADERNFYGAFNMWQLFSPTTEDAVAAGDETLADTAFLKDKVVIVFLEMRIADLKNCTTNDCDDKGSEAEFTIQPLLISQKDLSAFKYAGFETAKAALPDIVLKRYNVPFVQLKSPTEILNAFYAITDATTLSNIANSLSNVYNIFKPILAGENTDPFSGLLAVLTSQLNTVKTTKPVFTEYFYDYIDDIVKNYSEFKEKADTLLVECCPDENMFPFHLALCEALMDSRITVSAYRNYFIHSPVFGEQKALALEVRMLFAKMKLLISEFVLPVASEFLRAPVKITPSEYGKAYLSNRAIPFYYDPTSLLNFWSYAKSRKGKQSSNLSYNSNIYSSEDAVINPLKYEIEPYNFFRVEGHIGKPLDTALANVIKQKQTFSLPFDVVALNVAAGGNLNGAAMAKCHFADLESLYNILLAELLCKIHEPLCFLSKLPYIDLAKIANTGIFSGFSSFRSSATSKESTVADSSAFKAAADFTSITELQNFIRSSASRTTAISLSQNLSAYNQSFIDSAKYMNPYLKGAVLKHFCNPGTSTTIKTVGQVYLETIQNNAVAFPKPGNIDTTNGINIFALLNYIYSHIFYFIDTAEEMFATILPKYLYNLDYNAFQYKYQLLVQEAEDFTKLLLFVIAYYENQNNNEETKLQDFIEDVFVDILIDEMEMITHLCMDDRIQQLLDEYQKRLRQLNLERMFSYYTMQHSGIDHKAGVPKGGTFILVYETKPNINQWQRNVAVTVQPPEAVEKTTGNTITTKTTDRPSALAFTANESDTVFSDAVRAFELNKSKLTEAELTTALSLIDKMRPIGTQILDTFNIGENIVFADFYLPYMCCSDCVPISYILQDTTQTDENTTIKLSRQLACNNEKDPITITVSPKGGVLSLTNTTQLNDTTYQIAIADLPVGDTTIIYTANSTSASSKITILIAADADFTTKDIDSKPGAVQFTSNAADDGTLQHDWNFGDPNSGANNSSNLVNPFHEFPVSDTAQLFSISHTIATKDGCKSSATKQLTIVNLQPPEISLSNKTFCNNVDGATIMVTVNPVGGTISPAAFKQINSNTFQAAVADLPLNVTNVIYTIGSQSASDTITIFAAEDAGFSNTPDPDKSNAIQFNSKDQNTFDTHSWDFGDPASGTFNTSVSPNPVHNYNFTGTSANFDVTHTVFAKNGCISKIVNTITVKNTQIEINESRIFCFGKSLPLEDVSKIKSAQLLNADELKNIFTQFNFSIDSKLQIIFTDVPSQTIQFTAKYNVDTGSGLVKKNVAVTVLIVNAHFNIKLDALTKSIVFTALEPNPREVVWSIKFNNLANAISKTGKTFSFQIGALPLSSNWENMQVDISIVVEAAGTKCTATNKTNQPITRSDLTAIERKPGGVDF